MGVRFRRSVRLLPGVRLTFSESGVSTSFDGRGGSVTVGKRGVHADVAIKNRDRRHEARTCKIIVETAR
jgi:hypothetical protein